MKTVYAYAAIIAMVGAVLFPALQDPPKDSFPLSTYPMFSGSKPRVVLNEVIGHDAQGDDYALEPEIIATSGEAMQVIATLKNAINGGRATRREFCEAVASRVASNPDYDHIKRVSLVTQTRDPVAFYEGRETDTHKRTWRRCPVRRGP